MLTLRRAALHTLVCALAFGELFGLLEARMKCPEGMRVSIKGQCEDCPENKYSEEENYTNNCRTCTTCDNERGSEVELKCLKTRDTKCRCRPGFIPWEHNSASCKCVAGCGVTDNFQECRQCEHGFFSNKINSHCVKWKECKAGVKVNGTKTSDVICNEESNSSPVTVRPTSNKNTSPSTHYMSKTPSQESLQSSTTKSVLLHAVTSGAPKRPVTPSPDNNSNIGTSLLLAFGIVGLVILAAVTCKLNIIPCIKSYEKSPLKAQDSECRRPVEESGDSSLSSLVKQNP